MKDPLFIQQMIRRGKEAGEKVRNEFSSISFEQLNWTAQEGSWSIGQCLDHLIISDSLYFPLLRRVTEIDFKMRFWENWSPFSGLFGKILVSQIQEKTHKKLNAPKIFWPSVKPIDMGIIERFHKHLDSLLELISDCRIMDLDRIHITSPVSKFVTYRLRHAITILVQHEHRHINQAIKIKQDKNFPLLQYTV